VVEDVESGHDVQYLVQQDAQLASQATRTSDVSSEWNVSTRRFVEELKPTKDLERFLKKHPLTRRVGLKGPDGTELVALNGMIHCTGSTRDEDLSCETLGCKSWSLSCHPAKAELEIALKRPDGRIFPVHHTTLESWEAYDEHHRMTVRRQDTEQIMAYWLPDQGKVAIISHYWTVRDDGSGHTTDVVDLNALRVQVLGYVDPNARPPRASRGTSRESKRLLT
jgi:hypothetical protein